MAHEEWTSESITEEAAREEFKEKPWAPWPKDTSTLYVVTHLIFRDLLWRMPNGIGRYLNSNIIQEKQ